MKNGPTNFYSFTASQWRAFMRLRAGEPLWKIRMHRVNIDALVAAGVAYETDSGWLRAAPAAAKATLLIGRCIQVPKDANVTGVP